MKRTASAGKNSRSNASSSGRRRHMPTRRETRYVLCVKNKGYSASLELGKLYRRVPDPGAEQHLMLRVIDESGEDYIFPAACFVSVAIPRAAERRRAARALAAFG